MPRTATPIDGIVRRLAIQGRIRMGTQVAVTKKDGTPGKAPRASRTFRLTSADIDAINDIATLYGGTPKPWAEAPTPGQWEVTVDAAELPIALPPEPLGNTPVYELWSGGGRLRSCDGTTALLQGDGPEGGTLDDADCICNAKQVLECKPITRLAVILREIRFGGVWTLEAHGWNAFQELPGMVDAIVALQERGITRAMLGLESRQTKVNGKTKNYVVPVVRLADSAEALVAGAARLGALAPAPSQAALVAAVPVDDAPFAVLEAETAWEGPTKVIADELEARVIAKATALEVDPAWLRDKLCIGAAGHPWPLESEDEWRALVQLVTDLNDRRRLATVTPEGKLRLTPSSS